MATWGFHAKFPNRTEIGAKKFLAKGVVGIGWAGAGDLKEYPNDVAPFRRCIAENIDRDADWASPSSLQGMITKWGNLLHAFVHEIKPGDIVLLHTIFDDAVQRGHVTGPYYYDGTFDEEYQHLRKVVWEKRYPCAALSDADLKSVRGQMSFFRIATCPAALLA